MVVWKELKDADFPNRIPKIIDPVKISLKLRKWRIRLKGFISSEQMKRNYILLSLTDMRAYPQTMISQLRDHRWRVILLPEEEEEDSSPSLKDSDS